MDSQSKLKLVDKILLSCYGEWRDNAPTFPKPMPPSEAGPSPSGQRRYLWTDAFAIVNFVSQAKLNKQMKDGKSTEKDTESETKEYLTAALKLITSVYDTLGNPRSAKYPMARDEVRGGHKGLRIGKTQVRFGSSDMGMTYDGMYWHYIVQFIFAVTRYVEEANDTAQLDRVVGLIKQVHPAFCVPGKGYRWKINSDLSLIPGREPYPNHDAATALCVYNIVNELHADRPLTQEIADLTPIVAQYYQQPISRLVGDVMDPLGLGLQLWSEQFFSSERCDAFRSQTLKIARPVLEHNLSQREHPDLNFRLYGALIGMQLYGETEPQLCQFAEQVTHKFIEWELQTKIGENGHSLINKVMLASAVNPLAFKATEKDAVVRLD